MILEAAFALVIGFQGEGAAARELEAIEQRLAAAYKAGDCAAWGALLAPDWTVTHISAQVITKAQALETCAATKGAIREMTVSEVRVRQFGESAVVTGLTRVSASGADAATVTLRFTDVFVRQGGRWLAVASHATRIGA